MVIIDNFLSGQECIPVGYVSPAAGSRHGGSPPPRAGTPWSRHPPGAGTLPEQAPPGQIPLNFPLGCGPGTDRPQLPPWLWA